MTKLLITAILSHNYAQTVILADEADVNMKDSTGVTPLYVAAIAQK